MKNFSLFLILFIPSVVFASVSYEHADSEVGCKSKYSKAKQEDIFNSKYKNHWFVWSGTVILPDAGKTSLNVDGKGTQDLSVTFKNPRAGYDLMEDQPLKVKFKMKRAGGCFLPFSGTDAEIVS